MRGRRVPEQQSSHPRAGAPGRVELGSKNDAGLAGSYADVVSEKIAGHENAQEKQDELENKLSLALADGTVLLAWINENLQTS